MDVTKAEGQLAFVSLALLLTPKISPVLKELWELYLSHRRFTATCFLSGVFSIAVFVAIIVLDGFPNSGDEWSYLFAAKTLLLGRFTNPVPPAEALFSTSRILACASKWVSQYGPGWPIILAAAARSGLPMVLVNPLLGVCSLLLTYVLAKRMHGEKAAVAAAGLLALSPFFMLNAASLFSHISCSFALLLSAWAAGVPSKKSAFAAGTAAAYAGLIRYFSGLLGAVPIACSFAFRAIRERAPSRLAAGGVGAGIILLLNGYYNYRVTGNPLLDPQSWYYAQGEFAGFLDANLPPRAYEFLWMHIVLLLSWTPPLTALAYVPLVCIALVRRTLSWLDVIPVAIILGYMLFPYSAGNQYGPRYYYEAYPFLLITVCGHLLSGRTVRLSRRVAPFVYSALVLSAMGSVATVPSRAAYAGQVVYERSEPFRLVKEQGVESAVVFLETGAGHIEQMSWRDLTRNEPDLSNEILYLRFDPRVSLCQLVERLKRGGVYKYRRDENGGKGTLFRLKCET